MTRYIINLRKQKDRNDIGNLQIDGTFYGAAKSSGCNTLMNEKLDIVTLQCRLFGSIEKRGGAVYNSIGREGHYRLHVASSCFSSSFR